MEGIVGGQRWRRRVRPAGAPAALESAASRLLDAEELSGRYSEALAQHVALLERELDEQRKALERSERRIAELEELLGARAAAPGVDHESELIWAVARIVEVEDELTRVTANRPGKRSIHTARRAP
jgi:hypothetical protein